MVDSYDAWHARLLGHVNYKYTKTLQHLGLIYEIKNIDINKCEICAETKLTKRYIILFK